MNKKILLIIFPLLLVGTLYYFFNFSNKNASLPEVNGVRTEEIRYFENFTGYLVTPESEGNYPGVLMIHEWWGLNTNIKQEAEKLAKEGYIVLAVDLFGSVASTPEEARVQTQNLNQEKAILNMKAGINLLRERGAEKIGPLGWCFGGAQSLQISTNEKLDATVIYYGNLITDEEKLKSLNSPVLGIFGDKDSQIPVINVQNFQNSLNKLGIVNSINIYPGVGHAFANPSNPNFAKNETEDAMDKTLEFLKLNLK